MTDGSDATSAAHVPTLDGAELAARAGTTPERLADLVARGVITPVAPDRFRIGDIHRLRLVAAFEQVGVSMDALMAASRAGRVSFDYYDELHASASPPSTRTYAAFQASLGDLGPRLQPLYDAFGIAEPAPGSRLGVDDEAFLTELLGMLEAIGRPDAAMRTVRLFAEATRRAADASLGVYGEVAAELGDAFVGLPPAEAYEVVRPWARIARSAPALAAWLTAQHMSHAVDAYSAEATEKTLEDLGFLPERPTVDPGIAFVDLTGFTRLSEEAGDEVAAGVSLRLGELARVTTTPHGGRVVKLLGDGVLLRFGDARTAVEGTLELLAALPAAGLPLGHAGVHSGRFIEREGDVFGRAVNLASRAADAAPSGVLFLTRAVLEADPAIAARAEPVGPVDLQGLGPVELFRIVPDVRA